MSHIKLSEVLDVQYIEQWMWLPNANFISYLLNIDGNYSLWCVTPGGGSSEKISSDEGDVTAFYPHPTKNNILFVQDKNLKCAVYDDEQWNIDTIFTSKHSLMTPMYSPDGNQVSFIYQGNLWVSNTDGTNVREISPPEGKVVPGAFGLQESVLWSPSSSRILYHFRDEGDNVCVAVTDPNGRLLWQSSWDESPTTAISWLDEDRILHCTSHDRNTILSFKVAEFDTKPEEEVDEISEANCAKAPSLANISIDQIYEQKAYGTPGALRVFGAWSEPNSERTLFITEDDGWAHLYLYDHDSESFDQMTFGECEDFGHMGDEPAWHPDGRYVCYSSNRTASGQRQLWLLDADEKVSYQVTDFFGTNVQPKWSPDGAKRLAFIHCDPHKPADLWIAAVDPAAGELKIEEQEETLNQLTNSKPSSWTKDKDVLPQKVKVKGAQDWDITGYLITPPGADDNTEQYPALVWVHGGPIRQMRNGFHPSRPYALFYAYSQYLAHKGYATLMINFRGGIGYGRDFRNGIYGKMGVDDIADVVAAGQYLKELPYIDADRVGVWGLSYGGYMTLTALTKYPEKFAMGVNLAGIWDFAQWSQWIRSKYGRRVGAFDIYFKGTPEESPELYRIGSPCNYKDNLTKPIINLHGTADANVDFAQMDRIVKDCVEMGSTYEAYYYPDEEHSFVNRSTWMDAFAKIEREFEKYLK